MKDIWIACPKCGNMGHWFQFHDGNLPLCEFCHTQQIDLHKTWDEYYAMSENDRDAWENSVLNDIVLPNPFYSEKSHQKMLWEKYQQKKEDERVVATVQAYRSGEVSCPYCGYKKFQMVPRSWSLLTGFLTNKVDRICERCKKRF